jgi:hypothetical protein
MRLLLRGCLRHKNIRIEGKWIKRKKEKKKERNKERLKKESKKERKKKEKRKKKNKKRKEEKKKARKKERSHQFSDPNDWLTFSDGHTFVYSLLRYRYIVSNGRY